jgi:colanic acid/amylovoran biosynthesis protein
MYIQIDNVGFINKGAELMLYAIQERLIEEKELNVSFVKGRISGTNEECRKANLFSIPNFQRFKIKWQNHFEPKRLHSYGLVNKKDVNAILDAGGFQFGDQWIDSYTKKNNQLLREYYSEYKNANTKIIFLPQAFGPFNHEIAKERIKIVFDHSDVIYAREQTSYNHLITLFGEQEKIKIAPDFTNLVNADITLHNYNIINGNICIIPNSKMISHTNKDVSTDYLDFLIKLIQKLNQRGEKVILLNHEGPDDGHLIQDIIEHFPNNTNVSTFNDRLDAYQVKAIIGHCKLLISSRFHGVVSGLNQQVPTFCTSWSHKYEELLNDYGVSENILNPSQFEVSFEKINNALNGTSTYLVNPDRIEMLKSQSEEMWIEIVQYLGAHD